jgi:hypothetical protein
VPALRRELAALTPGKRAAGVRRVLTVRRFLLWRAGIESRRQQLLAELAGTCPSYQRRELRRRAPKRATLRRYCSLRRLNPVRVCKRTLWGWLKRYTDGGAAGLLADGRGRRKVSDPASCGEFPRLVRDHGPFTRKRMGA